MLAQPQGLCIVHQHEAEHHLDTQQQRMEVPIDRGLLQQLNMVARRNAAEGSHALAVAFSILTGRDLIAVIPHPIGTGLRKQIIHDAVPLNS